LTSDPGGTSDRGLRAALLAIEELRGDLLQLAAHVIALQDELAQRAGPDEANAIEASVQGRIPDILRRIRAANVSAEGRVHLGDPIDKYDVPPLAGGGPPCFELLPLCEARCCSFEVPLSSQDLDEGVLRWDRGKPYLLQHDADHYCTHLSREGPGCTCYAQRPAPCREYDCREDARVWIDYEKRIVAPRPEHPVDPPFSPQERSQLAVAREVSLMVEAHALRRPR
jgi:hypothetical protein